MEAWKIATTTDVIETQLQSYLYLMRTTRNFSIIKTANRSNIVHGFILANKVNILLSKSDKLQIDALAVRIGRLGVAAIDDSLDQILHEPGLSFCKALVTTPILYTNFMKIELLIEAFMECRRRFGVLALKNVLTRTSEMLINNRVVHNSLSILISTHTVIESNASYSLESENLVLGIVLLQSLIVSANDDKDEDTIVLSNESIKIILSLRHLKRLKDLIKSSNRARAILISALKASDIDLAEFIFLTHGSFHAIGKSEINIKSLQLVQAYLKQ
jgi:hypothetical protein